MQAKETLPQPPAAPNVPPGNPSPGATEGPRSGLMTVAIITMLALAIAIGLSIHSRIAAEASLKKETLNSAAILVRTIHPTTASTIDEITLPGSAQAYLNTPIYARTSGYLKSWNVDIGQRVKKGQMLAEIETPEVDQQLEQALADLKSAQANLDLSQLTATRMMELYKTKTVSSQDKDQGLSNQAAKKALVASSQANVRRLEEMKAFEKVLAPFDGIITTRNTDIGALIQAGDSTGAKELFHLADNHMLRVYFSVPEMYSSSIKAGEKMQITFDSVPGEKFTGDLVRDSSSLDPLSHTLMVEADVENPSGRLFPGGHATVHLKFPAATGTVTIPANTLLLRGKETCVALVRDGRIVILPINIARDHGKNVEVAGVITPQDSVVLDPQDSLAEGAPAHIEDTP